MTKLGFEGKVSGKGRVGMWLLDCLAELGLVLRWINQLWDGNNGMGMS